MLDLAIINGLLVDPETRTMTPGFIGVRGGRIVTRDAAAAEARQTIDAKGHLVSPGFIDIHGHLDGDHYTGLLSLQQGITTTVGGNCGYSPVRLAEFFAQQEAAGYPIHQAEMVGHSYTLRHLVGLEDPFVPANAEQIARMVDLARHAFDVGACGLSLGLGYAPGSCYEEALALCRLAKERHRMVAIDTHMRTKIDLYSLVEAISLARDSGAHMHISHFVYQYGDGCAEEALALVRHAQHEGLHITLDSGLYMHWATSIGSALFDPALMTENDIDPEHIRMATGQHRGMLLTPELYAHVRACHPDDAAVVHVNNDEAVYEILREPDVMPSSDAGAYQPGEGHPQIAGTFPRFFHQMVVQRRLLNWPEAVYRATLLPARTLGLAGRGTLAIGAVADLVIFDPQRLRDRANYVGLGRPDALPDGIRHVIVGGTPALHRHKVLCETAGSLLRYTD